MRRSGCGYRGRTCPEFTHFTLDEEAARQWTRGLPLANTRSSAQQLRQVISDLNRVGLAPETRFQIVEALRPDLLIVLSNLAKRFLNQPLIMPEEPRQMAELADSLFGLAATAYATTAVHTIQRRESVRELNPARLVCESLHRAVGLCGRNILQSLQLYQPVEPHLWLTLHQLYALAERQKLATLPVTDSLAGSSTIMHSYLRTLMLGCAKPNQLRQSDLAGIYRGLQEWSSLLELSRPGPGEGLFLVDLGNDSPPIYSALHGTETGVNHREIDTRALVQHLDQLRAQCRRQGETGIQFDDNSAIPLNILDHLTTAYSTLSLRNYNRVASDSNIWISIGLSSAHYHLSGGRTFEQLLSGASQRESAVDRLYHNPFLQPPLAEVEEMETPADDEAALPPGNELPDASGIIVEEVHPDTLEVIDELSPTQRYPVHCVRMLNASPAGYGLSWPADQTEDLKTGTIVSVREENSEGWSVAAVRWVNRPQPDATVVGVELLSPTAKPYGAIIHQKTGAEAQPRRVLLLPEMNIVGQPHTLITPRAGFREQQKVTLLREGEEYLVQLQRLVMVTGSFARFDFRYIKQLEEVMAEDRSWPLEATYDSVWSNI